MKARSNQRALELHACLRLFVVVIGLACLELSAVLARATNYALGTTALLEGPAAGTDSVVLAVSPATDQWTATTNASWLHLSAANQSGVGSTNVIFSFDANSGPTRTNMLTIGDQTLSVTQAGSAYVAARLVATLVSSNLNFPSGVAVDGRGNIYIADSDNNAIKKWSVVDNNVTTLVSSGLNQPYGLTVDGTGNVYIADTYNNAVKVWTVANSNVMTLVSTNLKQPTGVAVDDMNNVYIADSGNHAIKKWTQASGNLTILATTPPINPNDVSLDCAGNVYFTATGHFGRLEVWNAISHTTNILVAPSWIPETVWAPAALAVDGGGNVYIADVISGIEKLGASGAKTTVASSGLYEPYGVAVDSVGNVYIADSGNSAIKELAYAFVDPTPKFEGGAAGRDTLPAVLPLTGNLAGPFAPTNDQPWLTITGVSNGVVSFSFTSNTSGSNRTANISLLGQTIPVSQSIFTTPILRGWVVLPNGSFQFGFSNSQTASFTVLSTTNISLPLINWTELGAPSNIAPGMFQFTTQPITNDPQHFYTVRSP